MLHIRIFSLVKKKVFFFSVRWQSVDSRITEIEMVSAFTSLNYYTSLLLDHLAMENY